MASLIATSRWPTSDGGYFRGPGTQEEGTQEDLELPTVTATEGRARLPETGAEDLGLPTAAEVDGSGQGATIGKVEMETGRGLATAAIGTIVGDRAVGRVPPVPAVTIVNDGPYDQTPEGYQPGLRLRRNPIRTSGTPPVDLGMSGP